jgi:hypothetical protein
MTKQKIADLSIHVFSPLIAGVLYYQLTAVFDSMPWSGYLPDGLWAYAFCSSILIVWNRKINITWLTFAALVAVLFEIMQYLHLISGTGDVIDVLIYLLAGSIAIMMNKFLSTGYNHQTDHKTTEPNK